MAWPCWPSHQSPLTALASGSAQFPHCWVVITEHGFDKCSRLLLLLLARSTAHLPGAEISTVQSYRQRGEKRNGVKHRKRERKKNQSIRKRRGSMATNGKKVERRRLKPNPSGAQILMLGGFTWPMLPSNLIIWVRSQFHSDRKGRMKSRQGKRRKTKFRWRWLQYSASLASTQKMLIKTSECDCFRFSKDAECSAVLVWQCRAQRCSSCPLSHAASSERFCCQVDNSRSFKTTIGAIQHCRIAREG